TVASGSKDKTIILYDLEAKKVRTVIKAHSGPVEWVWPLPDGKTLASYSQSDPAVKLWDIATGEERASLGHDHNMKYAHTAFGLRMMVTVDKKGIARVGALGPEQKCASTAPSPVCERRSSPRRGPRRGSRRT